MKIFPSQNEKVIFVAIISFCFGLLTGLLPALDAKTLIGAVATLITAFAGAFFAFKLNEKREKRKSDLIDIGAANRTIFSLIRVYNFIAGYNKQFVEPSKGKPDAYVSIQPSIGNSNAGLKIDFDSISFLIPQKKSEILGELAEFEELFSTLLELLKTRNHIHSNIVQPKMEAAGITQGEPITLKQIDEVLGDRVTNTLKNITNELVSIMESGEQRSEQLIDTLHEMIKGIYPGENIIKMQKLNKPIKRD